jgi:hypothetical protein
MKRMTQCPHCGAPNQTGKFCANCGGSVAPAYPGTAPAKRPNLLLWMGGGLALGLVAAVAIVLLVPDGSSKPSAAPVSSTAPATAPSANPAPAPKPAAAPAPSTSGSKSAPKLPSDPNNPLVGGFMHIRIPGAVYTQQAGDTLNLYVSGGTMTKSSLIIFPDNTYAWNSAYDGKLIQGRWVKDGADINLLKGQEGMDWRVSKGTASTGGDILIYTSSVTYLADRAKE